MKYLLMLDHGNHEPFLISHWYPTYQEACDVAEGSKAVGAKIYALNTYIGLISLEASGIGRRWEWKPARAKAFDQHGQA